MTNPTPIPHRRLARRIALLIAGCVLLVSSYVSTWLAVSRAAYDGIISGAVAASVAPVFRPIVWYCEHDWIGVDSLQRLWWRLNPAVAGPTADGGTAFYPNPDSWPLSPGM